MIKQYRLFVASPSDVRTERDALSRVVTEINQTHGSPLGYSVQILRWETHATPSGGTSTRSYQRADREVRSFCWNNVAPLWDADRSSRIWDGRGISACIQLMGEKQFDASHVLFLSKALYAATDR
jgi:endonuclease I